MINVLFWFVVMSPMVGADPGAPPQNDSCANAMALEAPGVVPFDNTDADTDGPANPLTCTGLVENGPGLPIRDLWYCWTSPCDGPVTVDTCGQTTVDTKIAVYQGCACPTDESNLIGCDNDACGYQSSVTLDAAVGGDYLIRLGSTDTSVGPLGGGAGTFRVSCSGAPDRQCNSSAANCRAPSGWNAVASDAMHSTVADEFRSAANGAVNHLCWWGAYFDGSGDCSSEAADDFTIRYFHDENGSPGELIAEFRQSAGTLAVEGPVRTYSNLPDGLLEFEYTGTHANVAVQSGACYWIEIANHADGSCAWYWEQAKNPRGRAMVDGLTAGAPDGFAIDDAYPADFAVCFNLPIQSDGACPFVPLNDACADRAVLTDGATRFDSTFANTDGRAHEECSFPLADEQIHRDIWYQYQATCTGNVRLSLCGSSFDTKLAVYAGNQCPGANAPPLACDDDRCGDGFGRQSIVVHPATAGEEFIVRVGGFADFDASSPPVGVGGSGVLTVDCAPAPPFDDCSSPFPGPLPLVRAGSNVQASPDCPGFRGGSVWLAFQVEAASSVSIEYVGAGPVFDDAWRGVFASCNCENSIAADVAVALGDGGIRLGWDCLPPGIYRYPIVAAPAAEGDYSVSVAAADCTSACMTGSGECCSSGGSPTCGEFDCCDIVCRLDDYCCSTAWDELCVSWASTLCATCPGNACDASTDECDTSHEAPGCNDSARCRAVCSCNPWCCILSWADECASCDFGDFDCDGLHRRRDVRYLAACYAGPCGQEPCSLPVAVPVAPISVCCPLGDYNTDGDVDLQDFAAFQNDYEQL